MKGETRKPPIAGVGIFGRLAIVLLAGLLATGLTFWQTRRVQLSSFRSVFANEAAARSALIKQKTEELLLAIQSLAWFFDATGNVDQHNFHVFAAACLPKRKELQALSWNPRVTAIDRAAFEQKATRASSAQFHITERDPKGHFGAARERETYYPALYIEPLAGNEAAVGFDVGSDPVRLAALERARDTGEPTVTEPVQLVQQLDNQAGFLIFAPVYQQGKPLKSIQERRAALEGFAVGIFHAGTVVEEALQRVEPIGLSLALFDRSAPMGRQMIYAQDDNLQVHSWRSIRFSVQPTATSTFTLAGRQWSVDAIAGPAYVARHYPTSYWLVLPAGLLLSVLATLYFGTILSSRERMDQLVAARTAELCQAQEMLRLVLDAIPVGVHWKNRNLVYLGGNHRFAEDAELSGPEKIAGKTDFDLPWKEYAELFRGRDRQVIETGQPILDYEQPLSTGDGRVMCLRQNKLPLRDAKGGIIGVLSTYEDITARKKAQEALQESEARYRAVVEYSADGIAVGVDNKVAYVNPAAVCLAGARGPADLLGRSILDFVHEDYRAEAEARRVRMLETGLPTPVIEGKLRRPDGSTIDAEWIGVPIVYGGKPAILNSFRDVTEHRRRAEALRASEAKYRQLHDSMMDAFLAADLNARLTDCNETFRQMLGYTKEETLTLSLKDFTPAKWLPRDYEIRQTQVLARGYSDIYQKEYCRKDGTVFPVELRVVLLRDDAGNPCGTWAIVRDITERKQAEEAMRQSREQLRQRAEELETIMGCAPVALWVAHDPQCDAISGNRMANSFDASSPPANWSANVSSPLRWLRDGRELKPEELPMQLAARQNTEIHNTELELLLQSGRRVSLLGSATPLRDADNRVRGCVGAFLDNTDRKRAEGLLEGEKRVLEWIARRKPLPEVLNEICRFIEELSQGMMPSILLLDAEGTCLRPIATPRLPPDWTHAITPLAIGPAVGSCGTAAWTKEQVVVSDIAADPRWTDYPELCSLALKCGLRACWSTPILSAAGELLGTFAIYYEQPRSPRATDLEVIKQVTHLASVAIEHDRAAEALRRARDELEERVRERTAELVQANQRLEEMDRLKSQFLATMSHELRTPLNSIIGFTGILRQGLAGPVNDEQKKQLGLVFGSARHLLSLINDLLDLSRIEAGKVDIEQESFDFAQVIDEVIQNLTPMAGQKNIRLKTELPGQPIQMVGDRKRCFQVLLNLANNAIKFTDRGVVKITTHTDGDQLRVCVSDTGIGIKPEQIGMLFEAFRQLDGSAKRMYEGTGLGLHLCRKLLELMQGQIAVESEFGKGSRFTISLPRRPVHPLASQE